MTPLRQWRRRDGDVISHRHDAQPYEGDNILRGDNMAAF